MKTHTFFQTLMSGAGKKFRPVKRRCNTIMRAKTEREVLSIYAEHPEIDVILTDVKMPDMDGYEATHRIRKSNQQVIVIAQTAYGLEDDYERAIKAGCNDYMSKPIDPTGLLALVNKHLLLRECHR
jgi:CheY-like chemotaxis protein